MLTETFVFKLVFSKSHSSHKVRSFDSINPSKNISTNPIFLPLDNKDIMKTSVNYLSKFQMNYIYFFRNLDK